MRRSHLAERVWLQEAYQLCVEITIQRFFAFTDGLSESLNSEGEEIGIDGSVKIIEDYFNTDSGKQLSDISKKIISTAGSNNLSDDLTLISVGK